MLTLTPDATQVIEQILASPEAPDGAGLRIDATPPVSDNGAASEALELRITVAPGPDGDDEVIEEAGARVFVEDSVSDLLADKTLDATVQETGVEFRLG